MSSATAAGVVPAVGLGVCSAVGVGDGVPVGDGAGVGVGVGSGVAVAVGAGVEVLVAVGGGAAAGVATNSGVCVGVGVATGARVSTGAAVAVSAAALNVADGADTALGSTGTGVSATGAACSPPHAAKAITADRHSSSSTAEAIPVPVGLPQVNFMAPFSAPGTAESMTQPVYPPGILLDSGGCLGRAVTPEFLFLRGGPAAGVGPAQRQPRPTVPGARHSWRAGSVESPELRPLVRGPVVRSVQGGV